MNHHFTTSIYKSLPGAIATALLGVVLLFFPTLSSAMICYGLSVFIFAYGAYRIILYFRTPMADIGMRSDFVTGLMLVAIALFVVAKPDTVISLLPALLGLLLILGAARETQIMLNLVRMKQSRWYVPLIAAIIQLILGLVILWNPFETAMVMMQFIGASVLAESLSQIIFSIVLTRRIKNMQP